MRRDSAKTTNFSGEDISTTRIIVALLTSDASLRNHNICNFKVVTPETVALPKLCGIEESLKELKNTATGSHGEEHDHPIPKGATEESSSKMGTIDHDTECAMDDLTSYFGRVVCTIAGGKISVSSGEAYFEMVKNPLTGICRHTVEALTDASPENRGVEKAHILSLKPLVAICDSVPARDKLAFAASSEKET